MITLVTLLQIGAALPADSVEKLRDRARDAEARYERLARWSAPVTWGGGGGQCDEIVGRFCIRFDSVTKPPAVTDDIEVTGARRNAIEAGRRFFSAAPGDRRAAGPLVRLLVDDERAGEAASAAGAYAALSRDTLWGELLQGYALHAAGAHGEAEAHFERGLANMDSVARRSWLDPSWLLDPPERSLARRLTAMDRRVYDRRLWRLADPFWLTPGNEAWVEHIARHVEAALLEQVPFVSGMTSWGDDVHELTIRYGTPTARTRVDDANPLAMPGSSFVEYWDTASRSYVPERLLTDGYAPQPEPGVKPPLYAATARSGYAWRGSSVQALEHQLTRFLAGSEVVVRVDAVLRADSAPRASSGTGALFLADSMARSRRAVSTPLQWQGDSARLTLLARAPPGQLIYSIEAIDSTARVAVRARHALQAYLPATAPWLSDILVCTPFPVGAQPARFDDEALRGRSSLRLARGDTLGIYAEAYRVARGATLEVELAIEPADPPTLVRRLFDWVGRTTGLAGPSSQPRVSWRAEATDVVHAISVNLPLDPRLRGRYVLVLRVLDPVTGTSAVSRRLVVMAD